MNPRNLFALTSIQCQKYQVQPDDFPGYNWFETFDEYESPPYIEQSTLRFWYNNQDANFTTHWHNAVELIVPLEEGYSVTVKSETYHLEPGDIFLIPPGELHSLAAPPSGARFIFLFELNFIGQLDDFSLTRSFFTKPLHITYISHASIYEKEISLIMETAAYYWGNSSVKKLHIYSCLMEFFANYTDFCCKNVPIQSQNIGGSIPKQTSQKLNTILKYIEQHYSDKITLESAADMVNLSKFYFTRIFKQYTGKTFYDYLNILRIHASEELLMDNSNSISYISKLCGYTSVSSFNRSFRKIKECTPTEFRNLLGHGM
ncbi:AraC family transcriptional regulator [Eisenbergiella sp.]